MTGASLNDRAVEVIYEYSDLGKDPLRRKKVSSGSFVRPGLVLTALHSVSGPGKLIVRLHREGKYFDYPAEVFLKGNENGADLAVLKVSGVEVSLPEIRYGEIDKHIDGTVEECRAIGFPWFNMDKPELPRSSVQIDGEIPTGSGVGESLLTLRVKNIDLRSRPGEKSEWAGISGSVVFFNDNVAVGVITSHQISTGNFLVVTPITAINSLTEAMEWWEHLDVDPQDLVRLPSKETARIRYLEKISRECGSFELPIGKSSSESSLLQIVFQPLRLRRNPLLAENLEREERRAFQDELENDEGAASHTSSNRDNTQSSNFSGGTPLRETAKDGEEALKESPQMRMIVLGGPGTGKTTLLRHLVSQYAKRAEKDPHARIPFFIPLTKLLGKTFKEYITSIVQNMIGYEHNAHILWNAIEKGHALVCLDGLDEVIDQRADIVSKINDLISYKGNICVVSSRFTRFRTKDLLDPQKFTMWELLPLDDTLRLELAKHLQPAMQDLWPTSTTKTAFDPSEFIKTLEQSNKVATWGRTPLLFSLAAAAFVRTGTLPSTNAGLYEQVTEGILQMREPDATPEEREMLLRTLVALALQLCLQRKGRIFTSNDLLNILPRIRNEQGENWGTTEMSKRIINSGVVEIVAQKTYGFIHQTFQEYLAASHVMSPHHDGTRAEEIIDSLINYIGESICRQVLVNIVHLANQQEHVLENILYDKLMTSLAKVKKDPKGRPDSSSTISWGITYILQDLYDYWYSRMYSTLEDGSTDGEIASTIGSVIEAYPRSDAVPPLITSMNKYEKKIRFIGALGEIGTEDAKASLFTFTKKHLENPSDPFIFPYLAKALGKARVEQAVPLLQVILEGKDFERSAKEAARYALWLLGPQEEVFEEHPIDLEEILIALSLEDEKGRPSDWRRVEAMAVWLQRNGLQDRLFRAHRQEILDALGKALYHQQDGARKPVARALGELGNLQTFHYLTQRLMNHEEPSSDVAQEMLAALIRLAQRNRVTSEAHKLRAIFSKILQAYPMLADEVNRTIQKYLERKRDDREEN